MSLMEQRVRAALLFGTLIFLLDWLDYRNYNFWGPKPLSDMWWHFPLEVALVFVVLLIFGSRGSGD